MLRVLKVSKAWLPVVVESVAENVPPFGAIGST
jgi:hypothetical protein